MFITKVKFTSPLVTQRKKSDDYSKSMWRCDKSTPSFGSLVEPLDKFYKVALQKGLKEKFGLTCKLDDLNSIAGPIELKKLIGKFTPRDFELGPKTEHFFMGKTAHQYAVDGSFRVNLHLHSEVSDGSSSPEDILEMCTKYANKIAKKLGKTFNRKNDIPPFTASLTDHDKFSGNINIIKEIAQNPEKYKNFKFAVGSEFHIDGYKEPYTGFEAIGLGFNPFDTKLNETITKTKEPNPLSFIKTVKEAGGVMSLAHPAQFFDRMHDDFFGFLKKNGVNGIEGNYQYCGFKYDKEFFEKLDTINTLAKKHDMFLTGGTDSHQRQIFGDDVSDELLDDILNH